MSTTLDVFPLTIENGAATERLRERGGNAIVCTMAEPWALVADLVPVPAHRIEALSVELADLRTVAEAIPGGADVVIGIGGGTVAVPVQNVLFKIPLKNAIANSLAIKEDRLWDILSRHGKRSIVIGVPGTYPPRPLNGLMVTDFLTPDTTCEYTHPPELKQEIENPRRPVPPPPSRPAPSPAGALPRPAELSSR